MRRGRDINRFFLQEVWGWVFFLLVAQVVAYALNLPTAWLVGFARGLSLTAAIFIGFSLLKGRKWKACLAWFLVLLALSIPGAYLEFPSDPWEHLRRIQSWRLASFARQAELPLNPSYLLNFSWLEWLGISSIRSGLAWVGGLWQLLVAYEYYRLIPALGVGRKYAWVHVMAFFCFFGIGGIGLRYYELAALMLSYAAFLRALRGVCEGLDSGKSNIGIFGICLCIIVFTHRQELIFLLLAIVAVWVAKKWASEKKLWISVGAGVWLVSLIVGVGVRYATGSRFQLGSWTPQFAQALCLSGLFGVACALFDKAIPRRLRFCTLAPLLALSWPLLLPLFQWQNLGAPVLYRLLYGSFWWSTLACTAIHLIERHATRAGERARVAVAALLLLVAGLSTGYPVGGRLWFQFHQPDPIRSLEHIDRLAVWIATNEPRKAGCVWLSDSVTMTGVASLLGTMDPRVRRAPERYGKTVQTKEDVHSLWDSVVGCGSIVPTLSELPIPRSDSWVAEHSQHWHSEVANPRKSFNPSFAEAVGSAARERGWKEFQPDPNYKVLVPSPHIQWTAIPEQGRTENSYSHLLRFPSGHMVLVLHERASEETIRILREGRGIRWIHQLIVLGSTEDIPESARRLAVSGIRVAEVVAADKQGTIHSESGTQLDMQRSQVGGRLHLRFGAASAVFLFGAGLSPLPDGGAVAFPGQTDICEVEAALNRSKPAFILGGIPTPDRSDCPDLRAHIHRPGEVLSIEVYSDRFLMLDAASKWPGGTVFPVR